MMCEHTHKKTTENTLKKTLKLKIYRSHMLKRAKSIKSEKKLKHKIARVKLDIKQKKHKFH